MSSSGKRDLFGQCSGMGDETKPDRGCRQVERVDADLCPGAAAKLVRIKVLGCTDRVVMQSTHDLRELRPWFSVYPFRPLDWARIESAFAGCLALARMQGAAHPVTDKKTGKPVEWTSYWIQSKEATEMIYDALGIAKAWTAKSAESPTSGGKA